MGHLKKEEEPVNKVGEDSEEKIIPTFCHGCGAAKPRCGILCHVKDGKFVRVEANPEAFDLLLSFLLNLEEEEPQEEGVRMFEIRMLSLFGYQPNMKRCNLCRRDWEDLKEGPALFFSPEKGGLVCETCSKSLNHLVPLSLGTARLIERISQMELAKIHRFRFTPQALAESRQLLPQFITYQLGKELRSWRALRDLGHG